MTILIIEPFYGGSHKYFIDHLRRRLTIETRLLSTPAQKWQQRMRASGLYFAGRVQHLKKKPSLIFASSYLNAAEFRGTLPASWRSIPVVLYFHENQLAYPNKNGAPVDFQFAIFQIASAVAADHIVFNSRYNRDTFLTGIDAIPERYRGYFPKGLAACIRRKTSILPVPVVFPGTRRSARRNGPVTVLWNHRWEHDKNPDEFFEILQWLQSRGYEFRLNVCGEQFPHVPVIFEEARKRLKQNILHWGYVESRRKYQDILGRSDIVISTSRQEFFGLSVMEAVAAGCRPMVPERLSYPELYPPGVRYRTKVQCRTQLSKFMHDPDALRREDWRHIAERYRWEHWIARYENLFRRIGTAQ